MDFDMQDILNPGIDSYRQKRKQLREAFSNMRHMEEGSPVRIWLESLIRKHMLYAEKTGREYPRRHNTFVQFFVADGTDRMVSRYQRINLRTVYKDIDHVLDRMMVFAYGIDGINWAKH
jgi:hypothetical protein